MLVQTIEQNPGKGLLAALAILCVPLACGATLVITVGDGSSLLMTGGATHLFPLMLCLMDDIKSGKVLRIINILLMCIVLWINICILNNVQVALYEGRSATYTLAQNMVSGIWNESMIQNGSAEIMFVGRPSANPSFKRTEAWERANDYAKFGRWWVAPGNNRKSWRGVLTQCGISVELTDNETYTEILESGQIENMGCFPAENSILVWEDKVIVKVSEEY